MLRQGLSSPDLLILPWVVQGLGRLQDIAALRLIEQRLQGLSEEARIAPAAQLAWYPQPEAGRLMERFIPNQSIREHWRREALQLQEIERQITLRHQGRAPSK